MDNKEPNFNLRSSTRTYPSQNCDLSVDERLYKDAKDRIERNSFVQDVQEL